MKHICTINRKIKSFIMDDTLNTYHYRDSACSARSLATLLVAWVCAAMVASILLRWSYMWIALAILTVIFLIACGYAACYTRQPHAGYRSQEERLRQQRNIETVAARVDQDYCADPPRYQTYWITDLPPPYSSPSISRQMIRSHVVSADPILPSVLPSSPPSYDAVIRSGANTRISRQMQRTTNRTRRIYRSQSYSPPRTCDKKLHDFNELPCSNNHICSNHMPTIISIDRNSNQRHEINRHDSRGNHEHAMNVH